MALDLDGSLESLGNSMDDLANALASTGECALTRFRSTSPRQQEGEMTPAFRWWWSRWWRYGRGLAIDRLLPAVDVIHVAGLATPPTRRVPLIISVDDLRPLRDESRWHLRTRQLQRAVARGATLVASSRTASLEVREVLQAARPNVVVVAPAVPRVAPTLNGRNLVVNVTGARERLVSRLPVFAAFAKARGARVVVIASKGVAPLVEPWRDVITAVPRREARAALADARIVVHISDGARFPSFAIAAMSAGVPTLARSTRINRELLDGAATLLSDEDDLEDALTASWENEALRAVLIAAGLDRASDYSPERAAEGYARLYREVVQGWTP